MFKYHAVKNVTENKSMNCALATTTTYLIQKGTNTNTIPVIIHEISQYILVMNVNVK